MAEVVPTAFAARLHEVCDDLGITRARGRTSDLASMLGKTPNAVAKWFKGQSMPELARAIRLADMARVNVQWLLQGIGPKRTDWVDAKVLVLGEIVAALPRDDGAEVIDFMSFKIDRAEGLIAQEARARYKVALDAFKTELRRRR